MANPNDLGPVIESLEEMQVEGIIDKYAIGGAFAAVLHAEPIATIDLDIFFVFKKKQSGPILSLDELYAFAKKKGFSFDHEFIDIHGWLIQFVESGNNKLWLEAVETANPIDIGNRETFVVDKEHLIAMWLYAGRAKDYQKIALFVEAEIIDLPRLNLILQRYGLAEKWEKEKWRFDGEK